MLPQGARRSACDRCHTLKSRCRIDPSSGSCERCRRLGLVCQSTRRRQAPAGRHATAHMYVHDHFAPYGLTADDRHRTRDAQALYGTPPHDPVRQPNGFMRPDLFRPRHPERFPYADDLGHDAWAAFKGSDMLDDAFWDGSAGPHDRSPRGDQGLHGGGGGMRLGPGRAEFGSPVQQTEADMGGMDMALDIMTPMKQTLTPPRDENQHAHMHAGNDSHRRPQPPLAGANDDGETYRSPGEHLSRGVASTASPPGSADSRAPEADAAGVGQELLALQARLCAPPGRHDRACFSSRLDVIFKETEALLTLMSRHVSTEKLARPSPEPPGPPTSTSSGCGRGVGGPPPPPPPPLSGRLVSSATGREAIGPAKKQPRACDQGAMTTPVVALVFVTCYLCLLQRYNSFLIFLEGLLRDTRARPSQPGAEGHVPSDGACASAGPIGCGEDEMCPRGRGGAASRAQSSDSSAHDDGHDIGDHLGKFQLFDSIDLNASYLVPLITRMIHRMYSFLEKDLGPGTADYERDTGLDRPQFHSTPNVAAFAVKHTLDMHREVLDRVHLVEQAIVR